MEKFKNEYIKRTQKNYGMSFRLLVVSKVEQGELSLSSKKEVWYSG